MIKFPSIQTILDQLESKETVGWFLERHEDRAVFKLHNYPKKTGGTGDSNFSLVARSQDINEESCGKQNLPLKLL